MAKARGKAKEVLSTVQEIQKLIESAMSVIDTGRQHEIRGFLEQASNKCIEVRSFYDPQ